MKVALDYRIRVGDGLVDSKTLLEKPEGFREQLASSSTLEGAIVISLDGKAYGEDLIDPILRLGGLWIRKLPWILAGDTETVALRNSEHCLGFVPAGDSVEVSLFVGSESEVEEYLVEPTTVRLDAFAKESLRLVESLLTATKAVAPALLESEDCRELRASLEEGRKAWREYQLHGRR